MHDAHLATLARTVVSPSISRSRLSIVEPGSGAKEAGTIPPCRQHVWLDLQIGSLRACDAPLRTGERQRSSSSACAACAAAAAQAART